jgi:hypothetical protein
MPEILNFIDHAARVLLWHNRYRRSRDESAVPYLPIRVVVQHTHRLFRAAWTRDKARKARRDGLSEKGCQILKYTTSVFLYKLEEFYQAYRIQFSIAGWLEGGTAASKDVIPWQPADYHDTFRWPPSSSLPPGYPLQANFLPPMNEEMWEAQWFE